MQNIIFYYDDVVNVVFDNYGNEYTVKEAKGNWKFFNYSNKKISVSSLQNKPLIRDFNDVMAHYIFCWHRSYPCRAIGYYVYIKQTKRKITLDQYFKENKA